MACTGCGTDKTFARGLCQACYWRLRRNGTIERKNVINSGKCNAAGCHELAWTKGLCSRHYQRTQHPLHATWKLLRSRAKGGYPSDWDDFQTFLAIVGDRPTDKHQLRRKDGNLPWSVENFMWLDPIPHSKEGRRVRTQAEYNRAWTLKRKYGVSQEQHTQMLASQGGVCAICKKPETSRNARTGKPRELSLDHCHRSQKPRGFLCSACNAILGHADDSIPLLEAALFYLRCHA